MPRQDLCARALEFSCAALAFHRRFLHRRDRLGGCLHQFTRSATAIGANVEEAQIANSRRDMAAKYAIALREARECRYWLRLLATDPAIGTAVDPLLREASEWVAMLTATVKKLRQ